MRASPPQKVEEAEILHRQALEERSKMLDKEHVDTLNSKQWLAFALYEQQKYTEAELFRQTVQRREKVLGKEHVDTLHSNAAQITQPNAPPMWCLS